MRRETEGRQHPNIKAQAGWAAQSGADRRPQLPGSLPGCWAEAPREVSRPWPRGRRGSGLAGGSGGRQGAISWGCYAGGEKHAGPKFSGEIVEDLDKSGQCRTAGWRGGAAGGAGKRSS